MTSLKKIPTVPDPHISEEKTVQQTEDLKLQMAKLQNILYAEKKHSILVILQGMDTSGKDSTIRKVFSAINPQGCSVRSFKAPSEEEQLHDFLWRIHPHVPARGMITIFNRSHYEDILFPSVHETIAPKIIKKRYEQINDFERYLQENGVIILKYYLHISKEEQKARILARTTDPEKKWKYDPADVRDEKLWGSYRRVYEKIISTCSREIPWEVIPADHKWYRNYLIATSIVEKMQSLHLKYPS